ncbi:MAG: hypothetical protein V9F00_04815 [Nocardioides sp.]
MFDRLSQRLQRDLARAEVDVRERVAPRLKSDVRYRRSVIVLTTVATVFWLVGCVLIVFGNYWQGALGAVAGMITSRGGGKWLNRDRPL